MTENSDINDDDIPKNIPAEPDKETQKLDWSNVTKWKADAVKRQNEAYLRNDGIYYKKYGTSKQIETEILLTGFGMPTIERSAHAQDLTFAYNHRQRMVASRIRKKLDQIAKYDNILMQVVSISVRFVDSNTTALVPVYRVKYGDNGAKYVDTNARVYSDWSHYLKTNQLDRCMYCYPKQGHYGVEGLSNDNQFHQNSLPELEFGESPSCHLWERMKKGAKLTITFISSAMIVASVATSLGTKYNFKWLKAAVPYVKQGNTIFKYVSLGTMVVCAIDDIYDGATHGDNIALAQNITLLVASILNPFGDYLNKKMAEGQLKQGLSSFTTWQAFWLQTLAYSRLTSAAVSMIATFFAMYTKKKCTPSDYFKLAMSFYQCYGALMTPRTAQGIFDEMKAELLPKLLQQSRKELEKLEKGIQNKHAKSYYENHVKPIKGSDDEYAMNGQLIRVMKNVENVNDFFCEVALAETKFEIKDNILLVNGQLNIDAMRLIEIGRGETTNINERLNAKMIATESGHLPPPQTASAESSRREKLFEVTKELDDKIKQEIARLPIDPHTGLPDPIAVDARRALIEDQYIKDANKLGNFATDYRLCFEAKCHSIDRKFLTEIGEPLNQFTIGGVKPFAKLTVTEYYRLGQVLEDKDYNKDLVEAAAILASKRGVKTLDGYCTSIELIDKASRMYAKAEIKAATETNNTDRSIQIQSKNQLIKNYLTKLKDPNSGEFKRFNEKIDDDMKLVNGILKQSEHNWPNAYFALYHTRKHAYQMGYYNANNPDQPFDYKNYLNDRRAFNGDLIATNHTQDGRFISRTYGARRNNVDGTRTDLIYFGVETLPVHNLKASPTTKSHYLKTHPKNLQSENRP